MISRFSFSSFILTIWVAAMSVVWTSTALAAPDETPREIKGLVGIEVDENTQFVANLIYLDVNNQAMTLSLEGEDAAAFAISTQGALTFLTAPDYEAPTDNNKNNTYVVRVNARDSNDKPHAIDIVATVVGVNEAPVLQTALEHELVEEQAFQLPLSFLDIEGDEFEVSLVGDDGALFSYSEEQVLSMIINPSFESPFDSGRDNTYQVGIQATDELGASATYTLTVSVLNRQEQGYFTGVANIELAELATKDGNRASLLSGVDWKEPDNDFTGQKLMISGLLPEDNLTIANDETFDLRVDGDTGEIFYQETLVANLDLAATGQAGKDLIIRFNGNTKENSANLILDNLVYSNSASIPTVQRQLKIVLSDAFGKLTSMQTQLSLSRDSAADVPLTVQVKGVPSLVDIDKDSDLDLVMGTELGKLRVYLNSSSNASFAFSSSAETSGYLTQVDVGDDAAPSFVDIDNDGDADLFVGNRSGFISYLENTTSGSTVSFTARTSTANPLFGVDVGAKARLAFVDIDDDGDQDVFIGNQAGELVHYINTGTVTSPTFQVVSPSPLTTELIGGELAPTFADIDSDGDQDALIGNNQGQVVLFENTGSARSPEFEGAKADNSFGQWTFSGAVTPIVRDQDQDADMDALIYDGSQTLQMINNESSLSLKVLWRVNEAPRITLANQLDVVEELAITLRAEVADDESDPFTLQWQQLDGPDVTLVIDNQPTLTFTSPSVEAETHLTFRLTASDGRDSRSQDILVRVFSYGTLVPGFYLPEITMVESLTVNENESVGLSALATDLDGQTLVPSWEQLSGPTVVLENADTLTPSFVAPEVNGDAVIVLQLTVSDGFFNVQRLLSVTVLDTEDTPSEDEANAEEDDSTELFGFSLNVVYLFGLVCLIWLRIRSRRITL